MPLFRISLSMPFRSRTLRCVLLAGASLWALPAAAHAADDDSAPPTVAGVTVQARPVDPEQPVSAAGIDREQIARTINAVTVEDTLRYLPSVLIRRRHIGDTQAPLATRTSGVGSSARSLIYADGVLLSALIGNNNSTASPRWGMVAPEEVERVEVLYGPFSAAYPGNSIGEVVEIATRTPTQFEAQARAAYADQSFSQYGTRGDYPTWETSASAGDRRGAFWWRASGSRIDSAGQPLSYVSVSRPAGAGPATGAIAGGFADLNRTGAPILVVGAGGLERQLQGNAKLKLGWEPSDALHASYLVGWFGQDDRAHAESYLSDASGQPVWSGSLNLGGKAAALAPSAFASGVYRWEESHWMQALTLSGAPTKAFSWRAIATSYDYAHDQQRGPSALPAGLSGGAGSLTDMGGTGWRTLDVDARWSPGARQTLRFGVHADRFMLASDRYALADWVAGAPGALTAAAHGKTETLALWGEDRAGLSDQLDLTVGARLERWRAYGGSNFSATPALAAAQPALSKTAFSPKAVLAWTPDAAWRASASVGVAYRFPTVSELYQTVTSGAVGFVPDPRLAPERALSSELALERRFHGARARLALFTEDVSDALISQAGTAPGTASAVNFVQNVDKVRARGAEAVVEASDVLAPGLDLSGSVTWVDSAIARDRAYPAAEGKRTPQVPRLRWTVLASWRASARLTLTAAARYSDRSYGTIENADLVSHTYQGFDPYLVADLRAVWRLNRHVTAAVGVDNLGGRDYFLFHPFPQRSVLAEIRYAY